MILHMELTESEPLILGFQGASEEFERGARRLFDRYGRDIRDLTQQLAPRGKTGFLANNVRHETLEVPGFEVGWFWPDFGGAGLAPYYWWQEFGTKSTEAQPSLGPAWESMSQPLMQDLTALFDRTMAR